MDKATFLREFRSYITTWFNDAEFINNPSIEVHFGTRKLKEFLDFYNPWWYDKNGLAMGRIEEVLLDPSARALTVAEAANYPEKWNGSAKTLKLNQLHPIPIATDTSIGRTFILDSNKLVCRLIFLDSLELEQEIKVVEVKGPDLQSLNGDLKALRQRLNR